MKVIEASSADEALSRGLVLLQTIGEPRESRAGPVLVSPYPVTTVYPRPDRRVLTNAARDANPFFHLFEALWMIGGRNDVNFPARFNARVREFSDDGETFHGAYGWRWRQLWGFDQIESIVKALRANPACRRQVLQMWSPGWDLNPNPNSKDLPCNLCCHVQVSSAGRLDLTVFCRSNDIVWGAYGSDLVTFSILAEYLAAQVGVPLGTYYQISDNWHGYVATAKPLMTPATYAWRPADRYDLDLTPFPLVDDASAWDTDLAQFFERGISERFYEPFFEGVVKPMWQAWDAFKSGSDDRFDRALEHIRHCLAVDWRIAATEWLERRKQRWAQKQSKGSSDSVSPAP